MTVAIAAADNRRTAVMSCRSSRGGECPHNGISKGELRKVITAVMLKDSAVSTLNGCGRKRPSNGLSAEAHLAKMAIAKKANTLGCPPGERGQCSGHPKIAEWFNSPNQNCQVAKIKISPFQDGGRGGSQVNLPVGCKERTNHKSILCKMNSRD